MILLPYRFCGDSHHAFAFPFVLIFLPLRLSCKESSTSNQAFLLRRKDVTALLGARNRYALRLADHQRSRQIVRDGTALLILACELVMAWVLLACGLLMELAIGLVLLACDLLMDLLLYKYW